MSPCKFDIIIPPQDIACEPGLQEKLANGDRDAFAWVYKNYCKRIYNYVLIITGDETTSEDIVQDVFIKLWRYKDNIKGVENFNAYLYMLARNHTMDILKGNSKREKLLKEYATDLPVVTGAADELVYFKETQQLVKKTIDDLPKQQRIVFELREQGLKRPAIASHLGRTEFSIKGHINRMLNYFKDRLKGF